MADAKITALANNTTIDDADLVAIVDDVAGTPTTEKRTVAELKAHIVNTTTVTAAGALMDSEVTNLAQVKAFDSSDYATAAQGSTADTAVQPASTDTLTNKTIDVDNNTISNIETDNIAAATLVTEADAILSNDNDTTLPTSAAVRELQDDTHNDFQMYGFLNQDETTLAFNDSTYVFTLGDAGAGWSYYRQGVKITISGDKTVTLAGSPPTAATYFIFIDDDSGTLTASTTPWTLADTKVPVALIEWNDSNTPKYIIGEERHSARIPRHVHKYLHSTQGTQFESGGVIAGYTVDGSSDAENTFSITETKIWDEDIQNTCAVFADPDGATDAYHIAFRTAADTWSWELSEVPFRYTAAGYIQYDSGGTMTQGQATEYYNTYLLATNYKGAARFVIIHGQSEFASLSAAQAEQFSDLTLTGFPAEEAIALWQLTWQTSNSYAMKGKARLAAEPVKVTTNITAASSAPGLGTISTQNADDVSITGGTITGITDLAVADGGTGASDAAGAKTNLGFITDLVDDTTPTLGGELDAGAHSIGFTMQTATGGGDFSTTVDWKLGNHMDFTFGAGNETFVFTPPTKPGVYTMSLKQDSTGSRTATWPATVKWPGGSPPTLTTTATTGYDVISFRYDGSNYYGVASLDFS